MSANCVNNTVMSLAGHACVVCDRPSLIANVSCTADSPEEQHSERGSMDDLERDSWKC